MSRFLFVVPPFAAHVNPTVSVGQELSARGHVVAWVAHSQVKSLFHEDNVIFEVATSLSAEAILSLRKETGAPWLAGMKVLWEQVILPLATEMLPAVEAAIDEFQPDALIVDQQALAGALAARRRGLRWATSSPSAVLLRDTLADYPNAKTWIESLLNDLQRGAGLDPVDNVDLSPELVILYTSKAMAGDGDFPASYRFVGPMLDRRPESIDFPWDALDGRPILFVSLGTLFAGQGAKFFQRLVEALADEPMQVVVSTSPELIPSPPPNFIVRSWVPLMDLFPRFDAVLCHAGTIVNEAFSHGIPAVVAPIAHEQSVYAQQAVDAGAAVRVRFNRVSALELRQAVQEVLQNPSYRTAAERIQASFREAGGARAAADAIEAIA